MNYVIDFVMLFLWLVFVPFLTGSFIQKWCGAGDSPVLAYLIGMFYEWAVFEVIAVPCIKVLPHFGHRASLSFVMMIWCAVMGITCFAELYVLIRHKKYVAYQRKASYFWEACRESTWLCRISFFFMIFLIGFQMYMYFFYQHIDADDARFIANAVAAWDSDTMLLIHPNTGEFWYWGGAIGELRKDAVSPWMIYIAMLSKLVCIHPTILAHTVLPVFLVGMGYGAYWILGNMLWKQDLTKVFFFVSLVCIFNIFGYTSLYTSATFFLTRIWQGKSVVAGIIIPFILPLMLLMEKDYANKRWNIVVLILNCAACLLSGMGLVFSALMTGCFAFVYALQKKSFKSLVFAAFACVPNIILGIIYIRL